MPFENSKIMSPSMVTGVRPVLQESTETRDADGAGAADAQLQGYALRWRAVEALGDAIVIADARERVVDANSAARLLLGHPAGEIAGMALTELVIGEDGTPIGRLAAPGGVWSGDLRLQRRDGTLMRTVGTVYTFTDERGGGCLCIVLPGAERRRLSRRRMQAQKLEAIGQLASGIAHEINTPAQYIGDNLRFLQSAYERAVAQLPGPVDEAELAFLVEEIPAAIAQSLDGIGQIGGIVRAVKQFATARVGEVTLVDLNHEVQSVLTVSRNEWKYAAEVVQELDPALPLVACAAGELKQVILSLVINAAQAIAAAKGTGSAVGTITVRTRCDGPWVELRVSDTGVAIPDSARERVFDPFFTTSDQGQGVGQGLAIAYDVVVVKHHGTIHFEPASGQGTTFVVRLPLAAPAELALSIVCAAPAGPIPE